ncbi:hypothetical protein ACFYL6_11855 [Micromonospora sp. NPDC007208]|uniref:hypothetical protein n=1 Tax=Micromonospora sp. NPDC007208 TaxID=3364236 RepID=UPI0036C9EDB2
MANLALLVTGWDLMPRQRFELRVQGRLVSLRRDHEVPTPGGDGAGVPGLRVESIRDDHHAVLWLICELSASMIRSSRSWAACW